MKCEAFLKQHKLAKQLIFYCNDHTALWLVLSVHLYFKRICCFIIFVYSVDVGSCIVTHIFLCYLCGSCQVVAAYSDVI